MILQGLWLKNRSSGDLAHDIDEQSGGLNALEEIFPRF